MVLNVFNKFYCFYEVFQYSSGRDYPLSRSRIIYEELQRRIAILAHIEYSLIYKK